MAQSEPRDWATEEAEKLVRMVACAADTHVMIELLAAKLRLIKHEGRIEGVAAADKAVSEIFKRKTA